MNKKQMLAAAMSAAILCGTLPAALAEDPVNSDQQPATNAPEQLPERVLAYVTITDLRTENNALAAITATDSEGSETVYNVGPNTLFVDSETGLPASRNDIAKGTQLYIYHSPAMTMSLPPQTYAEAVVVNTPQDVACAHLHTAEKITKSEDGITILTDRGSLFVSAQNDTPISPWLTKNIVRLDDIQEGDRFFAWYDVVAQSYPAQASTSRIVLLPPVQNEQPEQPADEGQASKKVIPGSRLSIVVDGDMVLQQQAHSVDGTVMVPLRAVAEALNCKVSWDESTQTATINNGIRQMSFMLGEDSYVSVAAPETGLVGMTAPAKLGKAPYMDDNYRIWVAAEAFDIFQGYEVKISGDSVEIAPEK